MNRNSFEYGFCVGLITTLGIFCAVTGSTLVSKFYYPLPTIPVLSEYIIQQPIPYWALSMLLSFGFAAAMGLKATRSKSY